MNSFPDNVLNAPERPEYAIALKALRPVLYNLPPKAVVIDGFCGSGKTTLGRFLAWRFNISLLETDLFLEKNQEQFIYRHSDIDAVIESRMGSDRPIIVEGVVSLRLFNELGRTHDFHLHVKCDQVESEKADDAPWAQYAEKFQPEKSANLVLNLPAIKTEESPRRFLSGGF